MRVVIANCTVNYSGRLDAHLPEAIRLIMVKADGCVAIHADGGAYKPLNWMNAPNTVHESTEGGELTWVVTNPKDEKLTIQIHQILSDVAHQMGTDPGLEKDGVEAHLPREPEGLGATCLRTGPSQPGHVQRESRSPWKHIHARCGVYLNNCGRG